MYVKFKKKNDIGIAKGQCSNVSENDGDSFIKDGYAEKIEAKEYDKYVADFKEKQAKELKESEVNAEKQNSERDVSAELVKEEEVEEVEEEITEVKLHELTEEDLKAFPNETQGMEIGTKVVLNEDDAFVTGADGLFQLGNVDSSSEDGENIGAE